MDGSFGGFVWFFFFSDVIFSFEIFVLFCKGFRVFCKGVCFETGGQIKLLELLFIFKFLE